MEFMAINLSKIFHISTKQSVTRTKSTPNLSTDINENVFNTIMEEEKQQENTGPHSKDDRGNNNKKKTSKKRFWINRFKISRRLDRTQSANYDEGYYGNKPARYTGYSKTNEGVVVMEAFDQEKIEAKIKHPITKKEIRKEHVEHLSTYFSKLIDVEFAGQSNTKKGDHVDESKSILNLGLYLSLLDRVIRKYKVVTDFTIDDEEYRLVLRLVSTKRKRKDESTDDCYERLIAQSKIFEQIYHQRGEISQFLGTVGFWGTRQQVLCGKVIADWLSDEENSMDPIFGTLLCPCGGRVGPGDSGWMHNLFYDDRGPVAYHAAVHDAFGYLITVHKKGPGYDYLKKSILNKSRPIAGQYDGISFWKKLLLEKEEREDGFSSKFVSSTIGFFSMSLSNLSVLDTITTEPTEC